MQTKKNECEPLRVQVHSFFHLDISLKYIFLLGLQAEEETEGYAHGLILV